MSATAEIKDSVYAKLLAKSLPRPIHTGAEHSRLTGMLLELDEREDLSTEEDALAEVLTLLIEDYEEKDHPLPRVSPKRVLSGRRSISKAQAKRLAAFFDVPVPVFI